MISRICSFRFCPLGRRRFRVELTQCLGSFANLSGTGKLFLMGKTSSPFFIRMEHLQASFNSMISPPSPVVRFAVIYLTWNRTGLPSASTESMISNTSHRRINSEFMRQYYNQCSEEKRTLFSNKRNSAHIEIYCFIKDDFKAKKNYLYNTHFILYFGFK